MENMLDMDTETGVGIPIRKVTLLILTCIIKHSWEEKKINF